VSAYNASIAGERRGALWVIQGEWLTSLARRALGSTPVDHDISDHFSGESAWWLTGAQNLERFGWRIDAVEGLVLASAPYWSTVEVSRAGQARLYEVSAQGISAAPLAIFQGEVQSFDAQLGDQIDMIEVMERVWVAIGSRFGVGNYATAGSVYTGWLARP